MAYPSIPLNKFHKTVTLTLSRLFRSYGFNVTYEQESILRLLCVADGIPQGELASMVGQDRSNISRTLGILVRKGFAVRV